MVSDDVILEQLEFRYDAAGNVIETVTRRRYHNAPDNQTGPLNDPATTPKARVTYSAMYPDALGRSVATVEYGTNGGTELTRPDTIPSGSDNALVSLTSFDPAGNVSEMIDPAGMVTHFEYDDAGRKVTQVDNYQPGSSSSSSSPSDDCEPSDDVNRTTRYGYTPDGQQATMTAENWRTGDQTTTWAYGTTLDDSDIASSQLLRSVTYPDSVGESDLVEYSYNRQSQRTSLADQRGCIHEYDYDKLGRQIHDRVTAVGEGVDDAVLRLSTTYEVRGMVETLTSWNNASVTLGDALNQSLFVYNDFQQLIADYQEHDGEVVTETTPLVQYGYEDGSSNSIRPTTMTYPDGRVLNYDYGTTDGINDAISRIASLIDDNGTTHLADYSFVGLGQFVVVDYAQPDVKYTLVNLAGTNDPDTGDIYSGWDRFGRVKDCRWYDYGNSEDVARLKYGYDRASDRLWREDLVAQTLGKDFDELYSYDGLHRLKDMQRGRLNGSNTAITDETFAQCWSLDSTSNWHGFREAEAGGAWTTVQSRTANPVNEITDITNSVGSAWVTPEYDAAGNTTTIPQPADPTTSYTATYDAWNRMVGLVDDGNEDTVQQNVYDARNFRITRFDYDEGILSETRHFYYTSEWRSIEERLGSSPDSADPERQQVWGLRYIDDLVLRDRDTNTNGSLDERLYGLQDANWNVVALIDASADAEERYLYAPFGSTTFIDGSMTILSDSSIESEVLFTGQRFDTTSDFLLFRNRWIDSTSGRFISRDPIGYTDGVGLYAMLFVLSFSDPTGLKSDKTVLISRTPSDDTFTFTNQDQLGDTVPSFQLGDCGGFSWYIRFELLQPAGPRGGYLLQHLVITHKVINCRGTDVTEDKGKSKRNEYWEAWPVAPGASWPADLNFVDPITKQLKKGYSLKDFFSRNRSDDLYQSRTIQGESCGETSFNGEFMYVDGPIPDGLRQGTVGPAGRLFSSFKDPGVTSESPTKGRHAITVRWNCCKCEDTGCPDLTG